MIVVDLIRFAESFQERKKRMNEDVELLALASHKFTMCLNIVICVEK